MMTETVSVIVPVYKAEKDLDNSLRSILDQTYPDLDVILVDDGSPDHCPEICDTWAERDARVRVIHQKNAGVSAARNAGIKVAAGKWIVFLDADDTMAPTAVEAAMKLAEENACDTVCWNCYKECDGKIDKYPDIRPDNSVYAGKSVQVTLVEALYYTMPESFYPGHMFRAVWGKLLSAEVIRSHVITFPVGQPLGEDAAFLADYFQVCRKVLMVNQYWNVYQITSQSAVRQYRDNLKELQMSEWERLCERSCMKNVDMDTVQINQYLLFDYQYVHNLFRKQEGLAAVYRDMVCYIADRKHAWKPQRSYDREKIHRKSMPVVWAMVWGFTELEALLCILREFRSRRKEAKGCI